MRSILIIFLFVTLTIFGVNAGFKDFVCGNVSVSVTCESDCIRNHGALGGECGDISKGDYNCYCKGYSPTGGMEKSLHCVEQTDDFRSVCTIDCICDHAAIGGYCDFARKACICQEVGSNIQSVNCPVKDYIELGKTIYGYLGSKGMGYYGMDTIVGLLQNGTYKY